MMSEVLMDPVKLDCELVERLSKANKPYKAVVIHLTPTVDKLIFLTEAELALVEYYYE